MLLCTIVLYIHSILYIYIYIVYYIYNKTEIFSPSNKIHREVGWAKDLSAPQYPFQCYYAQQKII